MAKSLKLQRLEGVGKFPICLLHLKASKRQIRHLKIIHKDVRIVPSGLIVKHEQDRKLLQESHFEKNQLSSINTLVLIPYFSVIHHLFPTNNNLDWKKLFRFHHTVVEMNLRT